MPANQPNDAYSFEYPASDGRTRRVHVECAMDTGEYVFLFSDIARSLFYSNIDKMRPACHADFIRHMRFEVTRRAALGVTVEGVYSATRASVSDDRTGAREGPAVHFHEWLDDVVRPSLQRRADGYSFADPEEVKARDNAYRQRQIQRLARDMQTVALEPDNDQ